MPPINNSPSSPSSCGPPAIPLLSSSVGQVVRQIDPAQPIFDLRTMQDRLDRSQQLTYARYRTAIMSGFGLAALALAAMGIYGVVRYSVMQRMPEFGIRIALGASTHAIFKIVVAESLRMAVVGSVFGILGSMVLSRLLDGVLYGSRAADPLIILAVGCGLVALAVAAASGPARRASRSDPMHAVRAD
jgi:ABC-type antimicrobial peptide transport system permease subunit